MNIIIESLNVEGANNNIEKDFAYFLQKENTYKNDNGETISPLYINIRPSFFVSKIKSFLKESFDSNIKMNYEKEIKNLEIIIMNRRLEENLFPYDNEDFIFEKSFISTIGFAKIHHRKKDISDTTYNEICKILKETEKRFAEQIFSCKTMAIFFQKKEEITEAEKIYRDAIQEEYKHFKVPFLQFNCETPFYDIFEEIF